MYKKYRYEYGFLKQITCLNHLGELYSNKYIFENGVDSTVYYGHKLYTTTKQDLG